MITRNPADSASLSIDRRRFLGAVAGSTLPMLAGCTSITDSDFVAAPVAIPAIDAEELGLTEIGRDGHTHVVVGQLLGILNLDTTVTEQFAIYGADDTDGASGPGDRLTVGAISTPKASVLGSSRNPMADLSGQRLLTYSGARWYFVAAGLPAIEAGWRRSPVRVGGERIEGFDGRGLQLTTRAGFLGDESDSTVAFVHYLRFETDDDVVFGLSIRQLDGDDPERPFVGPEGYLTENEFEADRERVKSAMNAFRYG